MNKNQKTEKFSSNISALFQLYLKLFLKVLLLVNNNNTSSNTTMHEIKFTEEVFNLNHVLKSVQKRIIADLLGECNHDF